MSHVIGSNNASRFNNDTKTELGHALVMPRVLAQAWILRFDKFASLCRDLGMIRTPKLFCCVRSGVELIHVMHI